MLSRIFASLALVVIAAPAAEASACNEEIVARIEIAPGAACWRYRGDATTFVGAFGADQRVLVHMRGEASESDPETGQIRTTVRDREPDATGPRGFAASGEAGVLAFTTPAAGTYRFGFSPCAMWGGQGTVEICAR